MKDYQNLTGNDFEFMINLPLGIDEIPAEKFDDLMTPITLDWSKQGWNYFVGEHSYAASLEFSGYQIIFSDETPFAIALKIIEEIVAKLKQYFNTEIQYFYS